jgi:tRNA pseudouridine38-40 synthase
MTRNIKMILCYEGTRYLGWQKTSSGPSIEEMLEKTLIKLLQSDVTLEAASRTDAGVHAIGQVVCFKLKDPHITLEKLHKSINALLPHDIKVKHIENVKMDFHPTLHNEGKLYHYMICTNSIQTPFLSSISWHYPHVLDIERMKEGASHLIGYHDFSSFCNDRASFTRDPFCRLDSIDIDTIEDGLLRIAVKGERFLYKMVRNIAGTLAYIGAGKISAQDMKKIISLGKRHNAGVTAPAHGLFLKEVYYPKNSPLEVYT